MSKKNEMTVSAIFQDAARGHFSTAGAKHKKITRGKCDKPSTQPHFVAKQVYFSCGA